MKNCSALINNLGNESEVKEAKQEAQDVLAWGHLTPGHPDEAVVP
jgi:hypothetical protein